MEQLDVEKLIGELEVAVDRLRALYEQYFMGFEKLEPTVPRKDVDRRIYVLRKEQIRNTALRFRFNMLLQRYNTYQTHWQRICREIENGTYKRHVLRAQRRFAGRRSSAPPPSDDALQLGAIKIPVLPALTDAKAAELAELDAEFAAVPAGGGSRSFTLDSEPPTVARAPLPPQPARPSGVSPHAQPSVASAAASRPSIPRPDTTSAVPRPGAPRPIPASPVAASPVAPAPLPPPRAPMATLPGIAPARPAPPPLPVGAPPRAVAPGSPVGRPPPPPASAPRVAASAPQPTPDRGDGGLSDARVRQLYAQYVDAKRKQNESTAAITFEGVAKSLRDSQAKLREKHGKAVDFEVSVRDGKAILKPVLK